MECNDSTTTLLHYAISQISDCRNLPLPDLKMFRQAADRIKSAQLHRPADHRKHIDKDYLRNRQMSNTRIGNHIRVGLKTALTEFSNSILKKWAAVSDCLKQASQHSCSAGAKQRYRCEEICNDMSEDVVMSKHAYYPLRLLGFPSLIIFRFTVKARCLFMASKSKAACFHDAVNCVTQAPTWMTITATDYDNEVKSSRLNSPILSTPLPCSVLLNLFRARGFICRRR